MKFRPILILAIILFISGGYFLFESIDFQKIAKAATQANYSENWQATAGIYSDQISGRPAYRTGLPASGQSVGYCGTGGGIYGSDRRYFLTTTGWQVSGNVAGTIFLENWKVTDGFFSRGFDYRYGGYVSTNKGIYIKGVPNDEFCDYDNQGFFSANQWLVSGVINPTSPTAYYTEKWDAQNGSYFQATFPGVTFYNGLPSPGTRCNASAGGGDGPCDVIVTSWQVSGTISDTPLPLPIQAKNYFVTTNPFNLTDSSRYEIGGPTYPDGWFRYARLNPQAANSFCNADSQALPGKTYRAVFAKGLLPAGLFADSTIYGSGETGVATYTQNSPYFHTLNESFCSYLFGSYDTVVMARYLQQGNTLGSTSQVTPYSGIDTCPETGFPVQLINRINEKNLRLLCVEG